MESKQSKIEKLLICSLFGFICLLILYPFWCIVSVSFTGEEQIITAGFKLIPDKIDLTSYIHLFKNPGTLLSAFGVTILVSVLGTLIGCLTVSMYAYAISRTDFFLAKPMAFIAIFTMFFRGGMASQYIINVSVLNLKNSIWALILPPAFSVMNLIIMKSYYSQLPYSLIESAKLDGANEYTIFARIMLPLAKPALATICLTLFVQYWNSYYEAMMYMDTGSYQTIQLMLQRMLEQADFLKNNAIAGISAGDLQNLSSESLRMATCVVTVVPMLLVFPRFQKYFVKGMAVGAVKG